MAAGPQRSSSSAKQLHQGSVQRSDAVEDVGTFCDIAEIQTREVVKHSHLLNHTVSDASAQLTVRGRDLRTINEN
jgi:hypothetical protein